MPRTRVELPWRQRGVRRYQAVIDSTQRFVLSYGRLIYFSLVLTLAASLAYTWQCLQGVEAKFFWDVTELPSKTAQISFAMISVMLGGLLALPLFHWIYKTQLELTRLVQELVRSEMERAAARTLLNASRRIRTQNSPENQNLSPEASVSSQENEPLFDSDMPQSTSTPKGPAKTSKLPVSTRRGRVSQAS